MIWRDIEILIGEILVDVIVGEYLEEIVFITEKGKRYLMFHEQECCECVSIVDICGELQSLIGEPITMAEEVTEDYSDEWDSVTWTFYKLATVNGYVTIRWNGSSNGYYSTTVDFVELESEN